jgi:hypothetical protein
VYNIVAHDLGELMCSLGRIGFDEGFVRKGHGSQMVAGPSVVAWEGAYQQAGS